jgi:hypothetical protein
MRHSHLIIRLVLPIRYGRSNMIIRRLLLTITIYNAVFNTHVNIEA